MNRAKSIDDLVLSTLARLGVPVPCTVIETLLVRDRCFLGRKFSYDGGYAIWLPGSDVVEFYDDSGTLMLVAAAGGYTKGPSTRRRTA
jgi:hypothetical protein